MKLHCKMEASMNPMTLLRPEKKKNLISFADYDPIIWQFSDTTTKYQINTKLTGYYIMFIKENQEIV